MVDSGWEYKESTSDDLEKTIRRAKMVFINFATSKEDGGAWSRNSIRIAKARAISKVRTIDGLIVHDVHKKENGDIHVYIGI